MSFIENEKNVMYHAGYFLAHEECTRITHEVPQDGAKTAVNGGKYVPMGTIFPSDDAEAIGIVYEDVDVTSGNMPASIVTAGTVYENRLTISDAAKTALEGKGFTFVTEPTVTRP